MTRFYSFLLFLSLCCAVLQAQNGPMFQHRLDSLFDAVPHSRGMLVHVEAPDLGVSWSGAAGMADEDSTALQSAQPVWIASCTKTYVSVAVMRLVEQSQVQLEDPISVHLQDNWLVKLRKGGYVPDSIRVEHLLSHTSGIRDYVGDAYFKMIRREPKRRWTAEEQIDLAMKFGEPLYKPGHGFTYSDANYVLLAQLIAKHTQRPYHKALPDLLRYEELGITSTWIPSLDSMPEGIPPIALQCWTESSICNRDVDISFDLYGGGGIAASMSDMARFLQAYFDARIVEDTTIRDFILRPAVCEEPKPNGYYMGLSVNEHHGVRGYGHGGFWGTVMMHYPELNASIAVAILERDQRAYRRDILSLMVEELLLLQKE